MEQIKKIKVTMVCHLSSPRIRSHLPLYNGPSFYWVRKMFGEKPRKAGYSDFASWNTEIADFFSTRRDVEFTIISPHAGMKKRRVSYEDNNVHYVFLDTLFAGLIKNFIKNRNRWVKINPFSKAVKKEINRIKPDLVVLMGLENSYYSCTVLGITKYPVFGMCQTVYNNPVRKGYGMWNEDNVDIELRLFKELKYFGVFCKLHYDLVRQFSPNSYIVKYNYPKSANILEPKETKKEYDFVNFAMNMDVRKGFPDAIRALATVKSKYPNVKLNLIGQCTEEKKIEYISMVEQLGLKDNVFFTPYFEKQSDMFIHIQKSRFALLPCKVDDIAGTQNQAMQLGLPIVVYKTSGTPAFNREKQCALIAEKENVDELAQCMLQVMDNPNLAETLKVNGREWQENKFEEAKHNGEHIVENFRAIIENFKNGTPIPQNQLFNPETDD